MHGQQNELVAIGMTVSTHNFAKLDACFDCGCATSDDNPLLNFSGQKGVREFSQREKKNRMENTMKLVGRVDDSGGGWDIEWPGKKLVLCIG